MTKNQHVLSWIDEMAAMTQPDRIVWIDGSEEQINALRDEACASGEMIRLNQDLLPGCYLHRTAVNDVARVEGRTFICTPTKEEAGNINNWIEPKECYERLSKIYRGSMKGRTMYVIPYSMSIVGSPFAKIGIELTDSIYVVLNMEIMTRVGNTVLEALGDSQDFIKGLHSKANLDEENRYICHFPAETFCWARSALRCASLPISAKKRAGWLSTCSFSASKSQTAKFAISQPLSRPPAARRTLPCSFLPSIIVTLATR